MGALNPGEFLWYSSTILLKIQVLSLSLSNLHFAKGFLLQIPKVRLHRSVQSPLPGTSDTWVHCWLQTWDMSNGSLLWHLRMFASPIESYILQCRQRECKTLPSENRSGREREDVSYLLAKRNGEGYLWIVESDTKPQFLRPIEEPTTPQNLQLPCHLQQLTCQN